MLNAYNTAKSIYHSSPTAANAENLGEKQDSFTYVTRSIFSRAFQNHDLGELETLLGGQQDKKSKEWLIDAAVRLEDSTKATQYLSEYTNKYGPTSFGYTREASILLLGYDDKFTLPGALAQKLIDIYGLNGDAQQGIAGSILDFLELATYTFPVPTGSSSEGAGLRTVVPHTATSTAPTGFSESISIVPNPTGGDVNIFISSNLESLAPGVLEVFDQSGKRTNYRAVSDVQRSSLDLSTLPNGIYFIRIISGNQSWVRKIIKR